MICEKCNKEHTGNFGSGRFCSIICANSRVRNETTKNKIKEGVLKSIVQKKIDYSNINNNPEKINKVKKTWLKKIQEQNWDDLKKYAKKTLILHEQDDKCLFCKLDTWLGKKLKLELDHIDGNHNNESRENLRCLCPNCHSQTDTYKKPNKPNKPKHALII